MPSCVREAVVLAGGEDQRLSPLTNSENPKCLLSVGNTPLLLYALYALKRSDIYTIFLVVNGDSAAAKVSKFVQKDLSLQEMHIKVVTAPPASSSADAVRAVADSLTGDNIVVMSGDTVTDISLASVIFTHQIRGATITTVLSKRPTPASEVTKLGKPPKGVDYVAIDAKNQRLLLFAYDPQSLRRLPVPHAASKGYSSLTITTEYCDACTYVLSRAAVDAIKASTMSSIKAYGCPVLDSSPPALWWSIGTNSDFAQGFVDQSWWVQVDGLPSMVNEQWKHGQHMTNGCESYMLPRGGSGVFEPAAHLLRSICPEYRSTSLEEGGQQAIIEGPIFCGVFLTPASSLCRRVNSLQALMDVNRELASTDGTGQTKGLVKERVHPTAEISPKAVIASGCIVGEQTVIEDKTSVKRSVIGPFCKLGVNAKILNSVLMQGCQIGDGVHIQNSILGPGVCVGIRAQLKNCQIGPNYQVADNTDSRDEKLM